MVAGAPETAHRNDHCAFGAFGPVCLVLWREIQVADLRKFADYSYERATLFPDGYCALSITAARLRAPPPEVRAAIVALTKEGVRPNYRGSTTVILGEGFFASVARAALAGMSLVGGPMMPEHVSRTLDEGADFCAALVGVAAGPVRAAAHSFYDGAGRS